jgi:hypothetical protein
MKHYAVAVGFSRNHLGRAENVTEVDWIEAESLDSAIGKTHRYASERFPGWGVVVCLKCLEDGETYISKKRIE